MLLLLTTIQDSVLVLHQEMLFQSFLNHSYLFLCLLLFFSSLDGPWVVKTARHIRCRPMSKNMISYHQCYLVLKLLRLWPIFQIHLHAGHLVHTVAGSGHAHFRLIGRSKEWLSLPIPQTSRLVVFVFHDRQRSYQWWTRQKGDPCTSRCRCSFAIFARSSAQSPLKYRYAQWIGYLFPTYGISVSYSTIWERTCCSVRSLDAHKPNQSGNGQKPITPVTAECEVQFNGYDGSHLENFRRRRTFLGAESPVCYNTSSSMAKDKV